jgi:hypothetical protein
MFRGTVKHVPLWMPGAGFRRKAEEWRKQNLDVVWNPFSWAKRHMVCCSSLNATTTLFRAPTQENGDALLPNLVHTVYEQNNGKLSDQDEESFAWACSAMFGGTTYSL